MIARLPPAVSDAIKTEGAYIKASDYIEFRTTFVGSDKTESYFVPAATSLPEGFLSVFSTPARDSNVVIKAMVTAVLAVLKDDPSCIRSSSAEVATNMVDSDAVVLVVSRVVSESSE
jgi:hypothetical protein